jgi:uncharacterized SAM-binding protein YcdF (DUF218 family)
LLLVLWAGNDFAYVSVGAETDYAAPADVILVLGCNVYGLNGPSDCIRARAGHAADLYKQGFAPHIIPSGGLTAQGPTEASVLTRVLEEQGVPAAAIVPEEQAHNTIQNILYSQAIMRAHGWTTAILVSEPFHVNRAALIARDAGMAVFPSPARDSPNWQPLGPRLYHLAKDTASLMVYQIKVLTGNVN